MSNVYELIGATMYLMLACSSLVGAQLSLIMGLRRDWSIVKSAAGIMVGSAVYVSMALAAINYG